MSFISKILDAFKMESTREMENSGGIRKWEYLIIFARKM